MNERAQMEGRLAVLEQEAARLRMVIDSNCKTIRQEINTALVDVDDLDIALASRLMDDLLMLHADLIGANSRISRLKRELGRG